MGCLNNDVITAYVVTCHCRYKIEKSSKTSILWFWINIVIVINGPYILNGLCICNCWCHLYGLIIPNGWIFYCLPIGRWHIGAWLIRIIWYRRIVYQSHKIYIHMWSTYNIAGNLSESVTVHQISYFI